MRPDRPPTPSTQAYDAYHRLIAELFSAAAAVATDTHAAGDAMVDRMEAARDEVYRRIQGNRPDRSRVSWADLRLMLAGTLRVVLAEIDPT